MKLKNIMARFRSRTRSTGGEAQDAKKANLARRRSATYRMRVESCIETILSVNETMDLSLLDAEVVHRFQHLKNVMQEVDSDTIREQDLLRIEEATNRLLQDIRALYLTRKDEVVPTEERMN